MLAKFGSGGKCCLALLAFASCEPISKPGIQTCELSGISRIWLGENTGETEFMASGILLGTPRDTNQIPDHWLRDIKFRNMRAGGSQLGVGARGWTHGKDDFMVNATAANNAS
jgi:hypothetical protein